MRQRRQRLQVSTFPFLAVLLCAMGSLILLMLLSPVAVAQEHLRLSTTTSTDQSGLLGVVLPPFEQRYHLKVDVIAVGREL